MADSYFKIDSDFRHYIHKFSKPEIKTYIALCSYMDNKSRICYPSLKRLKEITGLAHRHLLNALKSLESQKFIKRDKGHRGRSTRYYIEPVSYSDD